MPSLLGTTVTLKNGRQLHVLGDEVRDGELRLLLAEEVVHQCPPEGEGLMPCCGRTPFEVPSYHRMTVTEEVTCGKAW